LYIDSYDRVTIVKAYPPEELQNASVIEAGGVLGYDVVNESVWISGILIAENRLIIIASVDEIISYDPVNYSGYGISWRQSDPHTVASVFNVTDPAAPAFMFSFGVSGYQLVTRMIDDKIYLVSQSYIWMTGNEYVLPKVWSGADTSELQLERIHYDPESGDAGSFVNILAVDLSSAKTNVVSVVTGYASTVYMSHDSLYLTFQKWTGGVIVLETGNVSSVESAATVGEENELTTSIYKISIDGISIVPAASGEVVGWLLDQFSMDEKDSYLRVATTTSWTNQKNAVYVLDSEMRIIGSVEGLAPEERIYAARFVDDTLYLVTFRQVDPFFVIDLSVPSQPKVLGQLHIPGFSSYLHPVDSTHILGIGMENGTVKIALFDVSDPKVPIEVSKYAIENYSWSFALWDYKGVLFDKEKELLVIPVVSYGDQDCYCHSSKAYVFNVSADEGVVLRGTVGHGNGTWILRSLYIGDFLYTVSESIVKVNSLVDLSEVDQLMYREFSYGGPTLVDSGTAVIEDGAIAKM
jgi:uncharacterized secreted protein with C-terminal beta-propeller domain